VVFLIYFKTNHVEMHQSALSTIADYFLLKNCSKPKSPILYCHKQVTNTANVPGGIFLSIMSCSVGILME